MTRSAVGVGELYLDWKGCLNNSTKFCWLLKVAGYADYTYLSVCLLTWTLLNFRLDFELPEHS